MKITVLLLILCMLIPTLSGCYSVTRIELVAYAIGMGIDISDTNLMKLTLQFALPGNSGEEGGGSGESAEEDGDSSQSSSTTIVTVDCSSIASGISLINSDISKKVNLAHCRVVVFSQSIAENGLSSYLYSLINQVDVRPDCSVVIAKCDAKDFLKQAESDLEPFVARFYDTITASSGYTGYTAANSLLDFFYAYKDDCSEGYTSLSGLITNDTKEEKPNSSDFADLDSSYVAGQTPIESNTDVEYMGLAVFREDRLVGELNGLETICHLMVTDKLDSCVISIANPLRENETIALSVHKRKNTKKTVTMTNGSPYITIDVFLKATVSSLHEGEDWTNKENLEAVQNHINAFLQQSILSYLYKTSQELQADIAGFGKYALKNYLTKKDFEEVNWLANFQNSSFHCNVYCNVESGFLLLKT